MKSATYFVTLVDFVESGDMSVFIDTEQLAALEARMNEKGYLDAQDMATSFNSCARTISSGRSSSATTCWQGAGSI